MQLPLSELDCGLVPGLYGTRLQAHGGLRKIVGCIIFDAVRLNKKTHAHL